MLRTVIFTGLALAASVGAAQAELEICNETGDRRSVAIGYSDNDAWTSEGWWILQPDECKIVVGGDLKNRYYYYRATVSGVEFEGEGYYFCTQSEPFTIVGDEDCVNRGYRRENFRQLDTGETAKSFKLTLSGGANQSQQATAPTPPPPPPAPQQSRSDQLAAPGTYGEPITVTGTLVGCFSEGDWEYCEINTPEWLYTVGRDNRTPGYLIDTMWGIPANTSVTVVGDMVEYTGRDVTITARDVSWQDSHQASAPTAPAANGNSVATGLAPGSYGEPVTITGTFNGCVMEGDFNYCEIMTNDWNYVLLRDDRTSDDWFQTLLSVTIGVTMTVEGDVVSYGDVSADTIPRQVTWTSGVSKENLIQGLWGVPEDTSFAVRFNGGSYFEYDGNGDTTEIGEYELNGYCDGLQADLLIYMMAYPNDPLCYNIAELDQDVLILHYQGTSGEIYYTRRE